MKCIVYLLISSVIIASLGLWYLQDPGNIMITWLGYEIQFSVLAGFILLILLYFILFICLRLLCCLGLMWHYCLSFFQRRKDRKEPTPPPLTP